MRRRVIPGVGGLLSGAHITRERRVPALYVSAPSLSPAATGGLTSVYADGDKYFRVHKFAQSGSFTVSRALTAVYLLVGGGGGGAGRDIGGGGGAGGFVEGSLAFLTPPQEYIDDLDELPLLAFSATRKLRSAYTGPAYRVRRDSDGVEADIGFDGDGNVDVAALSSFVGSSNGRIVTWYNQGGGSNMTANGEIGRMPFVVDSGNVVMSGGKPAIRFNNTPLLGAYSHNQNLTAVATLTPSTNSIGAGGIFANRVGYSGILMGGNKNYPAAFFGTAGVGGGGLMEDGQHIVTWLHLSNGTTTVRTDGSDYKSGVSGTSNTWTNYEFGRWGGASQEFYVGLMSEFVAYGAAITANQYRAIEAAQASYYSLNMEPYADLFPPKSYAITVGQGGNGGIDATGWRDGRPGSDTAAFGLTAVGGGGGNGWESPAQENGGSGGGGAGIDYITGGSGIAGQGNNGGDGVAGSTFYGGAGGGGAGAAGADADQGRHGGIGRPSTITGAEVYYAGGGGGAGHRSSGNRALGNGGIGGGGAATSSGGAASNGTDGLGGGGGASRSTSVSGGHGGSGVVIIRYEITKEEFEAHQ